MTLEEYLRLSAVELAAAIAAGTLSAREVLAAALDQVDRLDGELRAFRELWPERADAAARAIEAERTTGATLVHARALGGVPVALKNLREADRLNALGAVPIGATSRPGPGTDWQTWGWTDRGPTLNPWNPDLTPGGSSAGSAVAVSTGMVPLATGTDGAGSIRIPAAWCGVLGLKPTGSGQGAVPGVMARHVDDLRVWLTGSAAPVAVPPPRVIWSADLGYAETDPEVAGVVRAALDRLVAAGSVVAVGGDAELLDPEQVWRARRGAASPGAEETAAENDRRLAAIFGRTELIATPTTPNRPHGHTGPGRQMSVALTWGFNVSGHPAISVPAGHTADGSPAGLQLVARHHHETDLFAVLDTMKPGPPR
ncbi:amidase [Kribbella antibiotica]|uniref:Amidase n=1 Tax=Kribbella antibiotica TaxID=190195 RepID=A0A4R4YQ46_9ACTN|nr:amidase [Kribbella antibiotica]TDD46404.1 amidase [Kribbella antibiotica]